MLGKSILAAAVVGLGVFGSAQAGLVTGGAPNDIAVFTTNDNSKDIALTAGSPTFTADLTTYATFIADVHTVAGYITGSGGTADLMHVEGPTDTVYADVPFAPYFMVGSRAGGESGFVAYKFVVQSGYTTGAGGLVHAQVYFRGQPSTHGTKAYLGIAETFTPHISNLSEIDNIDDFKDVPMSSVFTDNPGSPYNTYVNNDVQMSIPQGASEFYVLVSDDFGSGRLGIGSLSVNANLVAVPEPASLSVLGLGALLLVRRRRQDI